MLAAELAALEVVLAIGSGEVCGVHDGERIKLSGHVITAALAPPSSGGGDNDMRAFRSALHSPHTDELRFHFAAASDIFDAHHMRAEREDLASLRPAIDPAPVCGGGQLGDRVAIVDAARTLGGEHNVSFGDAVDDGVVFHDDERMHHV